MTKINRFFLKCLSSNRLSERTKLSLLLFIFFIIGVISISGICLLLYWLKWKSIVAIIVYIFIFFILTFIKNKYRNNFWQFLSSIISLPKYLIYFIYPTYIIVCSYIYLIVFSGIPALFLINILFYIFKFKLLGETAIFILLSSISIVSVYGQKIIRWVIKKYSLLKQSFEQELIFYVIHRSNLIFFIYSMYLLYFCVSNFIQIQYHSPLISIEIDNAILKSFLVFIACSNMLTKSKEVEVEAKELFVKIIKLFIQGKQIKEDIMNNNNDENNRSLIQKVNKMNQQQDFLKYQAPTSPYPRLLEVERAEGSYIYTTDGRRYLDFVAGVSACTLGHCHPAVVKAIQEQCATYMHVMVYGEYVQKPAVDFCKLLAEQLPPELNTTYLVNSGTEAIEGSVKLAKRATGRTQLIAAKNAYHGNTQGSMSLMGYEERKRAYRPLIPDVDFIEFNNEADILKITERTAGVVLESIQGGAGFIEPQNDYLIKVKRRCEEVGALLIIDEIQPGFGRTGKLFGFQNYGFTPDIIAIGKGMASGMPVGAFVSSYERMQLLANSPKMGHITTFGGNPVIAAASLATLNQLLTTDLMAQTLEKEKLFRKYLQHPLIESINGRGLMLAVIVKTAEIADFVVNYCQDKGLIVYWLLFEHRAVRLSPPLTLTDEEIKEGCDIILEALNQVTGNK